MITLTFHTCEVCSDHAEETADLTDGLECYYVEGLYLSKCTTCGLLACPSCMNDGHCCARRGAIESEGLPKAGQMDLFEGETP